MKTLKIHTFIRDLEKFYDDYYLFKTLFHNCEVISRNDNIFILTYKGQSFKAIFDENHEYDGDSIDILPYSFNGIRDLSKLKEKGNWIPLTILAEKIFPDENFKQYPYSYYKLEEEIPNFKDKTFYSDQVELTKSEYKNKFILTNTYFYWNRKHNFRFAYEYKDIHTQINHKYKIGYNVYRNDKIRGKLAEKLNNIDDCFVSQLVDKNEQLNLCFDGIKLNKLHSDVDFDNLIYTKYMYDVKGNYEVIVDMFFRLFPNFSITLIDETFARNDNNFTHGFLSEKTWIPLLANMPFLSTHTYPLECIQKIFNVGKHPFYDDIKKAQCNIDGLITFIKYFLTDYENNLILLKNYTNSIHNILVHRLRNENSLLEKILK